VRIKVKNILLGGLLALTMLACGAVAEEIDVELLVYRVTEPEAEPYISRLLVTHDYLRLDQGNPDDGFILLDRKARVVYSVNPDDQSILVLKPEGTIRSMPAALLLASKQIVQPGMPEVVRKKVQHWEFYTNGKLCRSAIVVPGLLPQATQAYADYLDLLGHQQLTTLGSIPAELQDTCDLTNHVYAPMSVLQKGLPLREWDELGRQQELMDFRELFTVSAEIFKLPANYRWLNLSVPDEVPAR
jgi:hypothetical protein